MYNHKKMKLEIVLLGVLILIIGFQKLYSAQVNMSWNANTETDLAGYKIYVGQTSRNYDRTVDVGNLTTYILDGVTEMVEVFFTLTAYDSAGNESDYSDEISGVVGDLTPPQIVQISPISLTEIRFEFDKILDLNSATNANNYSISPNVSIIEALSLSDRKTIRLVTSEHTLGDPYILSVENVHDTALPPNTIAQGTQVEYVLEQQKYDTTPPTITLATLINSSEMDVYFSEAVESGAATEISNYSINKGVGISAASQMADNIVRLTTTEHTTGINYTIAMSNITDVSDAKNKIVENSTYSYSYNPGDIIGPVISLVNVLANNRVEILFNEQVEETSATTLSNYSIDGGIQITSAELNETGQVVNLTTSEHTINQTYVLTVNNIKDASPNKNKIGPNTQYTYQYREPDTLPPTIKRVDVLDDTHIKVFFSEGIDPVSGQNASNYFITDVSIFTVRMDGLGDAVVIETSTHQAGQSYVLTINNVMDASVEQNVIAENSKYTYAIELPSEQEGPTIVEAVAPDDRTILVTFNKAVEKSSAETTSNYHINQNITISSATLNESGTVVRLTTSQLLPDVVYIMTINNVTDISIAKNPIIDNSQYSVIYKNIDETLPLISLVKTIDAENIDVLFTESIKKQEAEIISNYEINGDINVLNVSLDGSQQIVHLHTTVHSPNKVYLLRVKNIKDTSPQENEIAPNSNYSYIFEPVDGVAPTIATVRTNSSQSIDIIFNEPVDTKTATETNNYQLNNNVRIESAQMGPSNNIVNLFITPLDPGKVYVLLVNNVYDLYLNRIANNTSFTFSYGELNFETGPRVIGVFTQSKDKLKVDFNVKVDKLSAEQIGNYTIQGDITIHHAVLDTSENSVLLQTSEHESNKIYVLLVKNISRADDLSQMSTDNVPFFYLYNQEDESLPSITEVNIVGETLVEIEFSKMVDRLSAENRHNYLISPGIVVLDVNLGPEGNKVLIETSRHLAGVVYTININGVRSSGAPGDVDFLKGSYAYAYLPSLQVTLDGYAETSISFLDVGKEYYLDRNYVITQVPDDLRHVKMIMTTNNDKENSDTRFMELTLSKSAFVYVAFDSRATSAPNWLSSKFSKTDMFIGVSEKAENLALWQGFFPTGNINFGGNRATGSRDANSMYIVLVQEPTFGNSPGGGSLEEALLNGSSFPTTTELHPNYPNPFNPSTTISFELPIEKQVRLTVHDILGRKVSTIYDSPASTGYHKVVWDATDKYGVPVAAGVYFYRLEVWENGERAGLEYKENYITKTGKMVLLK
jgi:hypothetical protein